MTKNYALCLIAGAMLSLAGCSDAPEEKTSVETGANAEGPAMGEMQSPVQAPETAASPTGAAINGVEDPSLPAAMQTSANTGQGMTSAFGKPQTAGQAAQGINSGTYQQKIDSVTAANRRMEEGVNQLPQ